MYNLSEGFVVDELMMLIIYSKTIEKVKTRRIKVSKTLILRVFYCKLVQIIKAGLRFDQPLHEPKKQIGNCKPNRAKLP